MPSIGPGCRVNVSKVASVRRSARILPVHGTFRWIQARGASAAVSLARSPVGGRSLGSRNAAATTVISEAAAGTSHALPDSGAALASMPSRVSAAARRITSDGIAT